MHTAYTIQQLEALFQQQPCWTINQLSQTMNYATISIRRFLKTCGYCTSFTHNNRWYTLRPIPQFNRQGLWFYDQIGFSQHGNLTDTILHFVNHSSQGMSARQLTELLTIPCHAVLHHLVRAARLDRIQGQHEWVYLAVAPTKNKQQASRRLATVAEPLSTKLTAHSAVQVLVAHIQQPQASFEELSKAVAKKQVLATPQAIARFFAEHGLKKTLN